MDDLGSVYDDEEEDIEGEGSDDDKVIFNDESDVSFDKEMVDFSGFIDKEEGYWSLFWVVDKLRPAE
ncbi:hypothetical protein N7490_001090 [Penicillium lividum]|nr:hypothetical protein N7490_001090 [Penicillium lividum]